MHIEDGILPPRAWGFWYVVTILFIIPGIREIDISIRSGERVAVLGANGAEQTISRALPRLPLTIGQARKALLKQIAKKGINTK